MNEKASEINTQGFESMVKTYKKTIVLENLLFLKKYTE